MEIAFPTMANRGWRQIPSTQHEQGYSCIEVVLLSDEYPLTLGVPKLLVHNRCISAFDGIFDVWMIIVHTVDKVIWGVLVDDFIAVGAKEWVSAIDSR